MFLSFNRFFRSGYAGARFGVFPLRDVDFFLGDQPRLPVPNTRHPRVGYVSHGVIGLRPALLFLHACQVKENIEIAAPPPDADRLIDLALKQRPDLQALTYNQKAADKFSRAQHELVLPTISALGLVGGTPVRPDCIDGCSSNFFTSSWFGAIGVNVSIPIFNGFLLRAEASEATANAKAAAENTRDLRDAVVRDVQTAWLYANTAFQRVGVTDELAKEADLSLTLANSRYQLGLGSIVELSEAQLQQANAAIEYVNAQYQYRLALSTLNFEIGAQP